MNHILLIPLLLPGLCPQDFVRLKWVQEKSCTGVLYTLSLLSMTFSSTMMFISTVYHIQSWHVQLWKIRIFSLYLLKMYLKPYIHVENWYFERSFKYNPYI